MTRQQCLFTTKRFRKKSISNRIIKSRLVNREFRRVYVFGRNIHKYIVPIIVRLKSITNVYLKGKNGSYNYHSVPCLTVVREGFNVLPLFRLAG